MAISVLHIVKDLDRVSGGPSRSIPQTAIGLAEVGVRCTVLAGFSGLETTVQEQVSSECSFVFAERSFGFAPETIEDVLRRTMGRVPDFDLVHIHGLWSRINHAGCRFARSRSLPYVISPRGMLEPWALDHKRLKKKLALWIYQAHDLKRSNALHATSDAESKTIAKFNFGVPITVIPNGIRLPPIEQKKLDRNSPRTLLFLSRIHPIKGIENLLRAWSIIRPRDWRCLIVGPGQLDYRTFLERQIVTLGIESSVEMHEAVDDDEKWRLMREASAFVLPSHSENFGMAIAEALASELPVITTQNTPWRDIEDCGCGWWVKDDEIALTRAIRDAVRLTAEELLVLGRRGRKLVEEKYGWPRVAEQLARMYAESLNQSNS